MLIEVKTIFCQVKKVMPFELKSFNSFQHACGGWEKLNPIPDGHSGWSMFEKLWEANQLAMKNVLEEETSESSTAKSKAKNYYMSCMDPNGTIESLGGKPLLQLLHNHLIGILVNFISKQLIILFTLLTLFGYFFLLFVTTNLLLLLFVYFLLLIGYFCYCFVCFL